MWQSLDAEDPPADISDTRAGLRRLAHHVEGVGEGSCVVRIHGKCSDGDANVDDGSKGVSAADRHAPLTCKVPLPADETP